MIVNILLNPVMVSDFSGRRLNGDAVPRVGGVGADSASHLQTGVPGPGTALARLLHRAEYLGLHDGGGLRQAGAGRRARLQDAPTDRRVLPLRSAAQPPALLLLCRQARVAQPLQLPTPHSPYLL